MHYTKKSVKKESFVKTFGYSLLLITVLTRFRVLEKSNRITDGFIYSLARSFGTF